MSIDQISSVDWQSSSIDWEVAHVNIYVKKLLFNGNILNFKQPKASPMALNPSLTAISQEKSIKGDIYQSFEAPKSIEKRKKDHPLPRIQRAHILRFKALFFTKKLHSKKIEVREHHKSKKRISICTKPYSSEISSNGGTSNHFFTFIWSNICIFAYIEYLPIWGFLFLS